MADFSGKIITAEYGNADYSIIKVLYEQDGMLTAYHLEADPSHPDFQELEAEGWTQEKIIDATAESKRAQAAAFNAEVMNAAKEMIGMMELEKEKQTLEEIIEQKRKEVEDRKKEVEDREKEVEDREASILELDKTAKQKLETSEHLLYNHIMSVNEDKDELFKFKLWALEQDVVKNAPKEIKSSLRKATRITAGMAILEELIK